MIERRQARIRRIRQRLNALQSGAADREVILNNPEAHHHIGISEKIPVHFRSFFRSFAGDPAIKVGIY